MVYQNQDNRRFRRSKRLAGFFLRAALLATFCLIALSALAIQTADDTIMILTADNKELTEDIIAKSSGLQTADFTYSNRLLLFDELAGTALGPLDSGWDNLWSSSINLQEDFRLEEIIEERQNRVNFKIHTVQRGETLWDISIMYGVDVATIAGANHDIANIHAIQPGMELRIMNIRGTVHVVAAGENAEDIAAKYEVKLSALLDYNEMDPNNLIKGQELVIPGAEPLDFADRGGALDSFVWPVRGGYISSPFGMRWGQLHEGLDIAVNTGTPVYAAKSGRVTFSGWNGGYGNTVDIDHGGGVMTRYAHNHRLIVSNGQYVQQGQIIAYSGNTGNSTGPHLHFEIRQDGKPVDPMLHLPPR